MAEAPQISDEMLAELMITREDWADIRVKRNELEKGVPQVGDEAPDFNLEQIDFDGKRTGNFVSLSSLRGKPVALYFGSYT